MQVDGFPHCCGAAIFYGFQEYCDEFMVDGKIISKREFKNEVQRKMRLAHYPAERRDAQDWPIGRISVLYAILTQNQPNSRRVLEELGWQRQGDPVVNANSNNALQLYVFNV